MVNVLLLFRSAVLLIFFPFSVYTYQNNKRYENAIKEATKIVERIQIENSIPCLSVAVSIDGDLVWSEGFGLADVENGIHCKGNTPMRVASISKSLTMAIVAKLWEKKEIDMDKPIQHYVPSFPENCFNGKKIPITLRQLATHFSGMRVLNITQYNVTRKNLLWPDKPDPGCSRENEVFKLKREDDILFVREHYNTVLESLELFKDDPLLHTPGTEFAYSNTGFNILGAVIENVTGLSFPDYVDNFFVDWGMKDTFAENHERIIPGRAKHYFRDEYNKLFNVPYYDMSNMWPSSGMWSTAEDLVQFSNLILQSYQNENKVSNGTDNHNCRNKHFLHSDTIQTLWTRFRPDASVTMSGETVGYGMGWLLQNPKDNCDKCDGKLIGFGHTGGLNGTSTGFFLYPQEYNTTDLIKPPTFDNVIRVRTINDREMIATTRTGMQLLCLPAGLRTMDCTCCCGPCCGPCCSPCCDPCCSPCCAPCCGCGPCC